MPHQQPRPCTAPRCPELVPVGGRCPAHPTPRGPTPTPRPSSTGQGYGAPWRRLRALVLAAEPLCVDPFGVHEGRPTIATDVDHIVARSRGGSDDRDNLQSLCHACHSRKTNAEDGGGWRRPGYYR